MVLICTGSCSNSVIVIVVVEVAVVVVAVVVVVVVVVSVYTPLLIKLVTVVCAVGLYWCL